VTFQLSEPDPGFIYQLGSPEFTIVGGSTGSPHAVGEDPIKPLALTGPYEIDSIDLTTVEIRLTRNPFFKEWSSAARPDGYPDKIVLRGRIDPDAQISLIDRGDADISLDDLSGIDLGAVRKASPGRVHDFTFAATRWFFLNTSLAPFNDPRVRKALNLAVDRAKLAAGDPAGPGVATCQLLPPNFPSYRPSCPSATGALSSTSTAPDIASALALVDASGTRGSRVEVWTSAAVNPSQIGAAGSIVDVLNALGYEASLHKVEGDYKAEILDPANRAQIGTLRWGADFLDPYDFYQLFTCDSGYNPGRFCDPNIDSMIARAQEIQITDQAAASALWADIDLTISDEFPWVAYANPAGIALVGDRVGNVQLHVKEGLLVDQLWVK